MATPVGDPEPPPVVPAGAGGDTCDAGAAVAAAGGVWLIGTGEAAADTVGRESGGDTEGADGVGSGIGGSAMNAAATMPTDQLLVVISITPADPGNAPSRIHYQRIGRLILVSPADIPSERVLCCGRWRGTWNAPWGPFVSSRGATFFSVSTRTANRAAWTTWRANPVFIVRLPLSIWNASSPSATLKALIAPACP